MTNKKQDPGPESEALPASTTGADTNYTPRGIASGDPLGGRGLPANLNTYSAEWTAQDAADWFEQTYPPISEPTDWPMMRDFDSDLAAALYWAQLGFEVRPNGWTQRVWLTRPEDIVMAWSGRHVRDAVLARAPRGTLALVSDGWPGLGGFPIFEQGPTLTWDERPPHAWQPVWDGPPVYPTFTVHLRDQMAVRLWTVPPGFQLPASSVAHHVPSSAALSTAYSREPFPLPCRSSSAWCSGMLQELPGHLAKMLDPAPLPCPEQDVKGNPCTPCQAHNNLRPAEVLAATRARYMAVAA